LAEISAQQVKELRVRTGAGIIDCRNALAEANGDLEKAQLVLRAKGLAAAEKKSGRVAKEGLVEAYIHSEGRLGVLVEVNCETDFVARTPEFKTLAHDVALQIAATDPRYVSRDEVPAEVIVTEREVYLAQAKAEGKPDHIAPKIAEGKLEKWFATVCLLDQPFVRDDSRKIADVVKAAIAKTGENIQIRRFARFRLGE